MLLSSASSEQATYGGNENQSKGVLPHDESRRKVHRKDWGEELTVKLKVVYLWTAPQVETCLWAKTKDLNCRRNQEIGMYLGGTHEGGRGQQQK